MLDDFAPKMAAVMTGYSVGIKGDYVHHCADHRRPAPRSCTRQSAKRHPQPGCRCPACKLFFRHASDARIFAAHRGVDQRGGRVHDRAIDNTKALAGTRRNWLNRSRQYLGRRYVYRRLRGRDALSPDAGRPPPHLTGRDGLHAYREFVYKACALDQPDPVAHWTAFRERQERLAAWLDGKTHAEVRGPGIDLSFDFKGRRWVSCHGTLNFPDGEIFTGPVEDSVNGRVAFSYPSLYMGKEVSGVTLTFKDGLVVEASAEKGEDHLLAQLEVDAGARRLGEFAIGTNMGIQQYTGNTLFDEKIGGTIHMALGHQSQVRGQQETPCIGTSCTGCRMARSGSTAAPFRARQFMVS